jgi:hypothetical protein
MEKIQVFFSLRKFSSHDYITQRVQNLLTSTKPMASVFHFPFFLSTIDSTTAKPKLIAASAVKSDFDQKVIELESLA